MHATTPIRFALQTGPRCALALILLLLMAAFAGCANWRLPRIDPSGNRFFLPADAPAPPPYRPTPRAPTIPTLPGAPAAGVPSAPGFPSGVSPIPTGVAGSNIVPAGPQSPAPPYGEGLTITPGKIIAPIGSEVILLASVVGNEGYMLTDQPVHWTIEPSSVGHLAALGERGSHDWLNHLHGYPRKISSTYAITKSAVRAMMLDRGTPQPNDDVIVQAGQAWVSVASPVEGVSHVTALSPSIGTWERRQQTAAIYWVDAQFAYPPPSANPAGEKRTLTTNITRLSNGAPIAGWIVRYEVTAGPEATFSPGNERVVEVVTNDAGQANADLTLVSPVSGANQITIQVIRPSNPSIGDGQQVIIGNGATTQTWTSGMPSTTSATSEFAVRVRGPSQARIGDAVTYRIEVSNPGPALREVTVTDQPPPGLEFLNSSPTADASPSGQVWIIRELAAGETRTIEANYRPARAGTYSFCAVANAGPGRTAKGCVTTVVGGSLPPSGAGGTTGGGASTPSTTSRRPVLQVEVTGPRTAEVGEKLAFEIRVTNRGGAAATGLSVTDRFDDGLEFELPDEQSPITTPLRDIEPGRTARLIVNFIARRAGQHCHDVTVTGDDNARAATSACVTVRSDRGQPRTLPQDGATDRPLREPTDGAVESRTNDRIDDRSSDATSDTASFTVKVQGDTLKRLGDHTTFDIVVKNTSAEPLENVRITVNYDSTLNPVAASDGREVQTRGISWTLPSLGVGRVITRQVECECLQATPKACCRATVTAPGNRVASGEHCLEILSRDGSLSRRPGRIDGEPSAPRDSAAGRGARERDADSAANAPTDSNRDKPTERPGGGRSRRSTSSAGRLSLHVADQTDPVRIGARTAYQIVVTNDSESPQENVVVRVRMPAEMKLERTEGAVRSGAIEPEGFSFNPIKLLRPKESVSLDVEVTAVRAGEAVFQAEATSDTERSPVSESESTEVIN